MNNNDLTKPIETKMARAHNAKMNVESQGCAMKCSGDTCAQQENPELRIIRSETVADALREDLSASSQLSEYRVQQLAGLRVEMDTQRRMYDLERNQLSEICERATKGIYLSSGNRNVPQVLLELGERLREAEHICNEIARSILIIEQNSDKPHAAELAKIIRAIHDRIMRADEPSALQRLIGDIIGHPIQDKPTEAAADILARSVESIIIASGRPERSIQSSLLQQALDEYRQLSQEQKHPRETAGQQADKAADSLVGRPSFRPDEVGQVGNMEADLMLDVPQVPKGFDPKSGLYQFENEGAFQPGTESELEKFVAFQKAAEAASRQDAPLT